MTHSYPQSSFSIKQMAGPKLDEYLEKHDAGWEDSYINKTSLLSGFKGIDRIIGGFEPGEVIALGARPSMGKSILALSIAINMSSIYKKNIGIISLETTKEQIMDRVFAHELRVDMQNLKEGKMSDEDFMRIGPVMDKILTYNIFIEDQHKKSLTGLSDQIKKLKNNEKLDFLIIDYLQLISIASSESRENRVEEIGLVMRTIKALAKELCIPILIISQLSRALESRSDKRPVLHDLRDSGSIEEDADTVIMLYRDEYYNPDTDYPGIMEVFIRKNRNGPLGDCDLRFDKAKMKFYNVKLY